MSHTLQMLLAVLKNQHLAVDFSRTISTKYQKADMSLSYHAA